MTTIRKLKIEDAKLMMKCLNDFENMKYMLIGSKHYSIDDCVFFIEKSLIDSSNYHFAVVNNEDKWIGTISLKNIDYELKQAEYSIITDSHVHGKGFAKIATYEILKYGFVNLGLNRIYLNVVKDNARANAFYKKIGFVFEGCSREEILIKGKKHDLNWYSFFKDDYIAYCNLGWFD